MTIEEKAKRYDEAIEIARDSFNYPDYPGFIRADVVFPELKQSESRRIRKDLIDFLEELLKLGKNTNFDKWSKIDCAEWITWLKKQGERKLTDKVEPKFKVEEEKWYICISQFCNCIEGRVYKATSDSRIIDDFGTEYDVHSDAYKYFRLWTIQDAKDGDVLAYNDGSLTIFRYRLSGLDAGLYMSHVLLTDKIEFKQTCAINNVHPTTKEQRDTLFAKMKEAGYEWNADNKELKKIEQKSVVPKFRVGDIITDDTNVYPHKKIEAIENENYVVRCLYTNNKQYIPINTQDEYVIVEQNKQKDIQYLDTSDCEPWSDEQARKNLINFLKSLGATEIPRASYNRYLSYLEKQGESTEINPSEFDSQLNRLLKQFKSLPKEDLASSLNFYLNVVQNDDTYKEEKQGEQKSAEIINNVYPETLDKAIDLYYYSYGNGNGYFENLSFEKFKDIVKSFVSDFGKQASAWSEEDEKIINNIAAYLNCYGNYIVESNEEKAKDVYKSADWLKSLKDRVQPQLKQKWGEEDNIILNGIIAYLSCNACDLKGFDKWYDWLISLKDKVQPKQEWSEEDEKIISRLHNIIFDCLTFEKFRVTEAEYSKLYDWIKSLKDRIQSQ